MNTRPSSLQIQTGTVKALASDGAGVVREAAQKVKFVPFVLNGEEIEFEVVESRAKFEKARLLNVLKVSPIRTQPKCSHFGIQFKNNAPACGSCQLQHASHEGQQELKRSWLFETCERIGKWEPLHLQRLQEVLQVVALKPFGYRHRARFHLGPAKASQLVPQSGSRNIHEYSRDFGYHGDASDGVVVDLAECHIVVSEIEKLIPHVRKALTKHLHGTKLAGQSFQVELTRYIDQAGKKPHVSLTVFHEGRDRKEIAPELLRLCLQDLLAHGVKNPSKEDLLLIQPEAHPSLLRTQRHCEPFYIHRLGFLQPHCEAAPIYRKIVEDMIRDSGLSQLDRAPAAQNSLEKIVVWDLYAGCGLFTESVFGAGLDPNSTELVHVELSQESIRAAKEQCAGRGLQIGYEAVAVSTFLRSQAIKKKKVLPQLVIADPPRSGMGIHDAKFLAALFTGNREQTGKSRAQLALESQSSEQPRPQIILICCDPAAFARDTAVLLASGYVIKSAFLVDAFPQTRHYECLAHLV